MLIKWIKKALNQINLSKKKKYERLDDIVSYKFKYYDCFLLTNMYYMEASNIHA